MKTCQICGHSHLNCKNSVYVRKLFPHHEYSELVPICRSCYERVKVGLIDYFLDESHGKATSPLEIGKQIFKSTLANSNISTLNRKLPFLSLANEEFVLLKSQDRAIQSIDTRTMCIDENKNCTTQKNNPQYIRQTLYAKSLEVGKLLFGPNNPAKDFGETAIRTLKPKVLLEIGSSFDKFSYDVAPDCQLTIRSDILKADLMTAKAAHVPQKDVSANIENLACDGTHLPIDDDSVDAAVSINMLHHLEKGDHEELLCEIKRVLKRNGYYLGVEIVQPHRELKGCVTHVGLHHIIRGEKHPPFLDFTDILSLIAGRRMHTIYADVYSTWKGDYACVISKKGAAS
jgi:SAM-dependent methyltransferase